jgi:hypothetical protein
MAVLSCESTPPPLRDATSTHGTAAKGYLDLDTVTCLLEAARPLLDEMTLQPRMEEWSFTSYIGPSPAIGAYSARSHQR